MTNAAVLAILMTLCRTTDATAMSPHVTAASRKYHVPPVLLAAVARKESGCHPGLTSRKGAVGRWQIMPGGLAALPAKGVSVERLATDEVNCDLAARHLAKWHGICGTWEAALGIFHGSAKKCSDPVTAYARDVMGWVAQAEKGSRS